MDLQHRLEPSKRLKSPAIGQDRLKLGHNQPVKLVKSNYNGPGVAVPVLNPTNDWMVLGSGMVVKNDHCRPVSDYCTTIQFFEIKLDIG
jgi:hypothetical protein